MLRARRGFYINTLLCNINMEKTILCIDGENFRKLMAQTLKQKGIKTTIIFHHKYGPGKKIESKPSRMTLIKCM